ncbi:MAG TPA: nucleotide exchange factor GrpE [Acidimicrobiales bacterium]|nr:nucleotide exchange factor GrpE [Acidimicrobiales bacterium]
MSPEVNRSGFDRQPVPAAPPGAGTGPRSDTPRPGPAPRPDTPRPGPGQRHESRLHDSIVNDDTAALIDDGGPADGGPGNTGPGGPGAGDTDTGIAGAEDSLEAVRRERDEYLDMVRRVQADFENYKKRTQRQQTDAVERAGENLVSKLLPALDALDLARTHLSDEEKTSADVQAMLQAVSLITDVLAKEGLERIDDAGADFDPTVHDAVEHAPAEGGAGSDVVADVLRAGYRWKGRLVRPAMVRVRG